MTDRDTAPAPAVRDAEGAEDADDRSTVRLRAYAHARVGAAGAVGKRVWAVAVGDVPSIWSEAPASPAGLVRYAREGAWCRDHRGFVRGAGRLYHTLVSIPVCLLLYSVALVVQRPGRLSAALFLVLILWLVL